MDKYLLIRDLIDNWDSPERSMWSKRLCQEIEENGFAKYKKITFSSHLDVKKFFAEYFLPIIASMKERGWREELGGVGSAVISGSGELLKTGSGNHRFFVAKILGLNQIPVDVVGIHSSCFHSRLSLPLTTKKLRMIIADIQYRNK